MILINILNMFELNIQRLKKYVNNVSKTNI